MTGPLSSLKILDFSTLLPGPFASLLLADLGAEVLRVEAPDRPDLVRLLPPHADGVSASHAYLNRNKRSLALDLKRPEAREVVTRLLQTHDILLEQFRPGVMARLGLDYDTLKALNPRLIYVSISGYGQTGPYRQRAGHDINYLALAGLASYTGRAADGPLPLGMQVADLAGGSLHGVIGLLAAVIQRQHTGEGQQVDVSMTDCAVSLHAMAGAGYLAAGVEPQPEGLALNGGSFYDYYRTRDGRWFAVGSLEPPFMRALCQVLDLPGLERQGLVADPAVQEDLKRQLAERFEREDFDHWCQRFAEADACVEPVLTLAEALQHPQLQARGVVTDVPWETGGAQRQLACPLRFSTGLPAPRHPGATLGAHTEAVLQECGYGEAEIAALRDAGAIR